MEWPDDSLPHDLAGYHQRTKHAPNRYALGPAFLDWESQPNPFRRFAGARLVELPLGYDRPSPGFGELGGAPVLPLDAGSLGLFLELGLGLSAWKAVDGARWAVRNNPSSGNLHPTEAYLVLPALEGIGKSAALWHYAVAEHALEERCVHDRAPDLPEGCFLVGLGSIVWREAWKYGERAFRYVQHDVGHAVGSLSYAAACLGWRLEVLAAPGDAEVAGWLGLDREDASHPYEREHPDLMAVVQTGGHTRAGGASCLALPERPAGTWFGAANAVSEDHEPWPVIDTALRVTVKPSGVVMPVRPVVEAPSLPALGRSAPARSATEVIRARRSVMRMDGGRVLGLGAFYRMLAATLPDAGRVPWNAFPWPARLALFVFVHRVEGLERGLYALVRDPDSAQRLRVACSPEFAWEPVPECPLPLFRLSPCDLERKASQLSCLQAIAGKGAFSLGMVADFARTLKEEGDWAYRRLFWEAGLIGQVLYLEATAAGVSGTGIGCFFDDAVHETLGIGGTALEWQSLYHFTVGTAVEDPRIATEPAYGHLKR
jgi:SagB-type dehydrogenase family enzyme